MKHVAMENPLHSASVRRRFYVGWALILVLLGTVNLFAVVPHLGAHYGGFLWIAPPSSPYTVGQVPWRARPPSPVELRYGDAVVRVDGQPPSTAPMLYGSKQPGELVTYVVMRRGEQLTIREPVRRFSWDTFFLVHGLLYLGAAACLVSGYILLRKGKPAYQQTLALLMPVIAGALMNAIRMYHGIEGPTSSSPLWYAVLGGAAVPVGSAILLHTLLQFPAISPWLRRHPRFPVLLYVGVLVLCALYVLSTVLPSLRALHLQLPATNFPLIDTLLYGIGIICLIWSAWTAWRTHRRSRRQSVPDQALVVRAAAVMWGVLLLTILLFWFVPIVVVGYTLLPIEILLAFGIVLPLGIVYALKNAELVRNLQQEIAQSRAYSRQVDALWGVRERTLHQLADRLHDEVLADLRAGKMVLESWQSGQAPPADRARQLDFVVNALSTLYRRVRDVVDEAKPMDWRDGSLSTALRLLSAHFHGYSPEVTIDLSCSSYDEADPSPVKDALYAVTRTALNNVREHAQAASIHICLESSDLESNEERVRLEIRDDGIGFQPQSLTDDNRRHLGIVNMQQRIAEIGGTMEIVSHPGAGTSILVQVPRRRDAAQQGLSAAQEILP